MFIIRPMDKLLELLQEDALAEPETLARMLKRPVETVRRQMRKLREEKKIIAYKAIIDQARVNPDKVRAAIDVRITPERGGGFNRIAQRISQFREVTSCHLMSGGYDLLVFVEGRSLKEVALFVSEKLATLGGVLSTTTHFMLKTYKDQGVLMDPDTEEERLKVSP
mgnify:CR=1 FL=1